MYYWNMRVHLIAIGGSAMHNLALALHDSGHEVTGSDDQIFEPSKSRLKEKGLLPNAEGWDPNRISADLDVVILGMHARKDNPELIKAQELGVAIQSYPEFVYERSKDKLRVVIAGSHGKTTITSMLLHVLRKQSIAFDFLVGAQLEGFTNMVQLSDAPIIVIEGDEYLTSPIDLRPKFLWYKPHLTCISGIAWDHINVFKTEEDYDRQFQLYLDSVMPDCPIFGCASDEKVVSLLKNNEDKAVALYRPEGIEFKNGVFVKTFDGREFVLNLKGSHNIKNLFAARALALELGVGELDFWMSIQDFTGAAKRLQEIPSQRYQKVFKDFAHAPSKVRATTAALEEMYADELVAVLELHTFSSLNKEFLPQYQGAFGQAKTKIVFFDPASVAHKKLPKLSASDVKKAFEDPDIKVITDKEELFKLLETLPTSAVLLMMSSGNWGGVNMETELA